jgi:hypothetical protein
VGVVEETGSPTPSSTTVPEPEPEIETDSPLDNANFLSFEDWKKKNLAAAGQSPENVGQARAASSEQRNRRRPVNINALDALGEESEIEIDFTGFGRVEEGGNEPGGPPSGTQDAADSTKSGDEDNVAPTAFSRSKDAGKTCKERFNYASFDCAATVLKTNNKAKSSSAVLVENKDSYMLNECSADNKYVIVELCDDILVDTVVLANYEFFSSMFRHFRVSVSDRYPVKMDRWRTLATFEARNTRALQPFLVTEPQIWARYIRIEFLTHYGNEFYCPISLLRVHGTTMMEQFRREEEEARGDDDFAEPIEAADGEPIQTAEPVADVGGEKIVDHQPVEPDKDQPRSEPGDPGQVNTTEPASPADPSSTGDSTTQQTNNSASEPTASTPANETITTAKASETENDKPSNPSTDSVQARNASVVVGPEPSNTEKSKATASPSSVSSNDASSSSQTTPGESKSTSSAPPSSQNGNTASKASTSEVSNASSSSSTVKVSSNSTANGSQSQPQVRSSSQTQPNPATPSTQESFFKSIHKRLQQLEMNSTLSLQYIEEQSRILRDAFMKVEKRQLSKTEKFLDHLNSTVMGELKSYRSMYDQLWQSTILELEGMKERQRAEIGEIGARLSLVADELVWQKRMAVVQSTLLLLCLGLVLFVRSGPLGSQQDIPIVQQIGNKYSQFFDSPPRSPENSGVLRRRRTFRNMWRSDVSAGLSERSGYRSDGATAVSDAETDGRGANLQIEFSPPTPITPSTLSDRRHATGSSPAQVNSSHSSPGNTADTEIATPTSERGPSIDLDDDARRIEVLATQSGPATPRGSRDNWPSWEEVDRAVDMLKAEEQGRVSPLQEESNRKKRRKRSALRRSTSYGMADDIDDSPGLDDGDGLFVVG